MAGRHGRARAGAIVLSGGGGVRLGGADKASLEIGGLTLLERVLAALAEVPEVVVVGPEVPTSRPVTFTREDPAGGGPAAGLLAGLRSLLSFPLPAPDWVLVLAVDMPLVSAGTVGRLLESARDDGAVLVDAAGRVQHLCAAYSTEALERAHRALDAEDGHGVSMHRLVAGLRLVTVAAVGAEARDLDTWEDLLELRATVDGDDLSGPGGAGETEE